MTLLAPVRAHAQVSVGALFVTTDHELLRGTMLGVSAAIDIARRNSVTFHAGVETASGTTHRVGIACAGLIQPGTCPSEPMEDRAQFTVGRVGIGMRALERGPLALDFAADGLGGQVAARSRGLTSQNTLESSKVIVGAAVGAKGSWTPSARWPVAVEAEANLGALTPLISEQVLDGYTPFETSFTVRRFTLGLAWHPRT